MISGRRLGEVGQVITAMQTGIGGLLIALIWTIVCGMLSTSALTQYAILNATCYSTAVY